MPALLVHLTAARETARIPGAPSLLAEAAQTEPGALLLGSILPDLPYHGKFGRQVLRHLLHRPYLSTEWGDIMHTRRTGRLALALLAHLERSLPPPEQVTKIQALIAGYLSHYALDRAVHPAINQLVQRHSTPDLPAPNLHNRLENIQSLLYHRDLVGYDILQTPYARQMINQTEGMGLFRPRMDCYLWSAIRSALLETHGRVPSPEELHDWLWGVTAYGQLISSPMGRWERPDQCEEKLRGTYYQGPDADLRHPLDRAMELTLDCWRHAEEVLRAERITANVRSAFLNKVPDIDFATGY